MEPQFKNKGQPRNKTKQKKEQVFSVSSLKRSDNLQQHFCVGHKSQWSGTSPSATPHLPKVLPLASTVFLLLILFTVQFDSASLAFCREGGIRINLTDAWNKRGASEQKGRTKQWGLGKGLSSSLFALPPPHPNHGPLQPQSL